MRSPVTLLIFLCLLVYVGTGRPHAEVDCIAAPYTAWSIIRHGSFDLRHYQELKPYLGTQVIELQNGAWVSMRPPGSAIFAIPFVLPLAIFREYPPPPNTHAPIGKTYPAAVSVVGAAVFFFLTCRRLAPKAAWPATLLLALGTCLCSVASQGALLDARSCYLLAVLRSLLSYSGI